MIIWSCLVSGVGGFQATHVSLGALSLPPLSCWKMTLYYETSDRLISCMALVRRGVRKPLFDWPGPSGPKAIISIIIIALITIALIKLTVSDPS